MVGKKTDYSKVELMAPAGSYACLQAAIKAGADAVYFGVDNLHMRSRAANEFGLDDIGQVADSCSQNNVRSYLVLNVILYDEDLNRMREILDRVEKEKVSAVIVNDLAAVNYARKIGLEVHISTQQNISNIESVRYFSQFADTVVLARELNLDQIRNICNQIKKEKIRGPSGSLIKIELFAHGALCVAKAGTCSMSLALQNSSAHRGECYQICRRSYRVIDDDTGDELKIDNKYIMSPKDLCTVGFLDQILKAGVTVLKLEGRGRSPDYVSTVTRVYRQAIDAVKDGSYSQEKIKEWETELVTVFNRGFWHGGYYLGKRLGEWCGVYGSKATEKKIQIGKVKHYYSKAQAAELVIESEDLKIGDEMMITGPQIGVVRSSVESIYVNDKPAEKAEKGQQCTVLLKEKVRKNDKLFKIVKTS